MQLQEARVRVLDKNVAYGILVRADKTRYGKLIEKIENDYLKGNDGYPKTPTETYYLLVNYRNYNNLNKRSNTTGLEQVAFMTKKDRKGYEQELPDHRQIKCFKCRVMGDYKSDRPKKMQGNAEQQTQVISATTLMTRAVTLAATNSEVNPLWILCDSESTIDIFRNKNILTKSMMRKETYLFKGDWRHKRDSGQVRRRLTGIWYSVLPSQRCYKCYFIL